MRPSLLLLARMARAQDVFRRGLVLPRPRALGRPTPGRDRMATTAGPAFTTTMRVIDRVHGDAANRRARAQQAHPSGLAEILVGIVGVRDRADCRHAFLADNTELARGQPKLCIPAIAADKLRIAARSARDLTATAGLQLDIVDDRANRHAGEGHRIAGLDVHLLARDHTIADRKPLRRQDIGLLAIIIADERDERGPVRVIFQPLDRRWNVEFPPAEIDDAVEPLYPTAAPAHRDPSGIVPSGLLRQPLGEALDGTTLPELRTVDQNQPTLAGRRRVVGFQRHLAVFRLLISTSSLKGPWSRRSCGPLPGSHRLSSHPSARLCGRERS